MSYVLKIGSLYLTSDGELSSSQADASRISDATREACRGSSLSVNGDGLRFVHLRPACATPYRDTDVSEASPA